MPTIMTMTCSRPFWAEQALKPLASGGPYRGLPGSRENDKIPPKQKGQVEKHLPFLAFAANCLTAANSILAFCRWVCYTFS